MSIRFVTVATLKRGRLRRYEVLDDANQWRMLRGIQVEFATSREEMHRAATWTYQLERDPLPSAGEIKRLRPQVS